MRGSRSGGARGEQAWNSAVVPKGLKVGRRSRRYGLERVEEYLEFTQGGGLCGGVAVRTADLGRGGKCSGRDGGPNCGQRLDAEVKQN